MTTIFIWVIPPLVGAVIGYVTNAVAIKMLFRPLKELRIFGVRVPFTPGILPRERRKLADSIGRMVQRELLTPEILKERLARPETAESLEKSLAEYTGKLLSMPPAEWDKGIPELLRTAAGDMYPRAAEGLTGFLRREDIRRRLEIQGVLLLKQVIIKMNAMQRFFITAGKYDVTLEEKMPEIVKDLIDQMESYFKSEDAEKKILGALETELRSFPEKHPGATIEKLAGIDGGKKERLDRFLAEKILEAAGSQIEKVLAVIDVKNMVADRINSLDMIRVERIILDVMAGQLKWINVFGAILGAIIGFAQVLLSLVM
jgi:uncharacterized membrane protein YheB (UPF0754 family)